MSDIALISVGTVGRPSHEDSLGLRGQSLSGRASFGRAQGGDSLDSPSAADLQRWGSMLQRCDGIRWHKVEHLRTSIARGDYLTDDRLEAAVHRLACDLDAKR
jgi:hypothetical protein